LIPFIPVGLTLALLAANWSLDGALPYRALPALVLSSLVALYGWRLFVTKRMVGCLWAGFVSAAFLSVGVFGFAQLDLRSLKISPRLAETARDFAYAKKSVATLGYREPSLVFLVGTSLDMLETGEEASAFLKRSGCGIVFVDSRFEGKFRAENERLGQAPGLSTRISGFNINSGRRVDIGVYYTDSGCI
jgi:hypothetical protein